MMAGKNEASLLRQNNTPCSAYKSLPVSTRSSETRVDAASLESVGFQGTSQRASDKCDPFFRQYRRLINLRYIPEFQAGS
jgi:hypothetical protein